MRYMIQEKLEQCLFKLRIAERKGRDQKISKLTAKASHIIQSALLLLRVRTTLLAHLALRFLRHCRHVAGCTAMRSIVVVAGVTDA
jgi:hypothetical protein